MAVLPPSPHPRVAAFLLFLALFHWLRNLTDFSENVFKILSLSIPLYVSSKFPYQVKQTSFYSYFTKFYWFTILSR